MAKKNQTLGEMYAEILSLPDMSGRWSKPIKLAECSVIGSIFPDASKARLFRYDIMFDSPYLFVDIREDKVIVVILKDELLEARIRALARAYEGEPYNVNLK